MNKFALKSSYYESNGKIIFSNLGRYIIVADVPLSANEIMKRLGIKSKETLRGSYLNPAIENGLVKRTIPDKPNSKNQKYYI